METLTVPEQIALWHGAIARIEDALADALARHEMRKAEDFRQRLAMAQHRLNTTH